MKVVILSYFSGHVERGAEVWAQSLQKSLKEKCEISILGNSATPNWNKSQSASSLLRKFFLDYWSLSIAKFTIVNLGKIRSINPDIIIPTNGGWQSIITKIFAFVTRKKMIIVGHSGVGFDDRWNLWCFPNIFVALSAEAQRWAEKINPFIKVVFIPNGVFLDKFNPKGEKAELGLQRPIYLYVGALEKGKRPALAIDAVFKLSKGSLLVLGKGELDSEISELGKNLLGERFQLMTVPHSEMAKYYRSCDVFTLPTWSHEAFGMVYLEAMACGLPVVTTDDVVKRDIVGKAGIFIDPEDSNSYSKALEKASKIEWGSVPLNQAKKFSWDKIGDRYLEVFTNLTR